ncbi:hypothetical protein [uncultured Aquimarina sp.]|uniref:hypothetical protein n=1 Tax=uncultured Aquimarina sp. TaxID=575652 RepID=UPI0026137F1D|nr:hypothetical protein [uncultured Aquimarina sp.]
MSNKINKTMISPEIAKVIAMWVTYLEEKHTNSSLTEIEKSIGLLARDRAWVYHGGSGNSSLFYLMDDCIQIRFDLDIEDTLISFCVFPKSEAWIKSPEGILIKGGEALDSDTIFM